MNKQTNGLQLVKGTRLFAAHAALAHARMVDQVRQSRLRGDRLQAIAKRNGISYNEVLDLVEEDAARRIREARENGFRDGVLAARFHPLPPSSAQGRAA